MQFKSLEKTAFLCFWILEINVNKSKTFHVVAKPT